MAELDAITEALRRQRKDLDDLMEQSQSGETERLLEKIEDLRRRAEETNRVSIGRTKPRS
jgi:hypothetical protein